MWGFHRKPELVIERNKTHVSSGLLWFPTVLEWPVPTKSRLYYEPYRNICEETWWWQFTHASHSVWRKCGEDVPGGTGFTGQIRVSCRELVGIKNLTKDPQRLLQAVELWSASKWDILQSGTIMSVYIGWLGFLLFVCLFVFTLEVKNKLLAFWTTGHCNFIFGLSLGCSLRPTFFRD